MSSFMDNLQAATNVSVTENGAIGYKTTGSSLLDLHYNLASLRNYTEDQITFLFRKAYNEDPVIAMRWLFYIRDIRGGLGERRTFKVIFKDFSNNYPEIASKMIPIISEYGRYDDILYSYNTKIHQEIVLFIQEQLLKDLNNAKANKPISLLAKWLPSANAGKESRTKAIQIINDCGLDEKGYRKILSYLRKRINLVESKMCKNEWWDIDYSKVPSKASLIYKEAFNNHDNYRYSQYLEDVSSGKTKINAGTLYPHEIVNKYSTEIMLCRWCSRVKNLDPTLEELWKALPRDFESAGDILVVRDGSGSMTGGGLNQISPLSIATALAIYFSETLKGDFKDKYLTFSRTAEVIDLSHCKTLKDKLEVSYNECDCSNTNIENVFNTVLKVAIEGNIPQEEMPSSILILSDMEFDGCCFNWNEFLFKEISEKYKRNGYKIPRLVFWNLFSRSKTIPMIDNEQGLVLTSGFSPNSLKMLLSNKLDPYEVLKDALNDKRYDLVEEKFKEATSK